MNFMEKLERKWGRYAIPGLYKFLIFAYFLGYLTLWIAPGLMSYLQFSMPHILTGQVWRLFTWIFCCEDSGLLTLLFLVFLLMMGRSLEMVMGTFRMNVFLIGGMVLTLLAGILLYIIPLFTIGVGFPTYLTNYYTLISMYMAMAMCMPDNYVYLYMVIPIKMKWMLLIYLISMGYQLFVYYQYGGIILMLVYGTPVVCTLLNVFFFFHFSKLRPTRQQKKRQKEFQAQFKAEPRPGANISRHKCVICGRTDVTNPELTFRYCSKCTGNKEYCQDHLFTHTHN